MRRAQAAGPGAAAPPQQQRQGEGGEEQQDQESVQRGQKRNRYDRTLPDEARRGNLEAVQNLIEKDKVDPNHKSIGCTALHYAAFYNHLHIVKYLLEEAKAELNPHNLSGITPLQWAVERQHYDVVEYLLDKGAELKIDIENSRNKKGETALHKAVLTGNVAITKLLLEKGKPDVNAKTIDEEGADAPLHFAAQAGKLDVIKYLLETLDAPAGGAGVPASPAAAAALPSASAPHPPPAALSAVPSVGKKVIITPIQHQRKALTTSTTAITVVGKGKIQVNIRNAKGFTPLHRATTNRHLEIVKLLVSKGADPNLQDISGRTVLHWAVFFGQRPMVRVYLGLPRERINIEVKDGCGYTPKELALVKNRKAIAREIGFVLAGGDIEDVVDNSEEEEEEEEAVQEAQKKQRGRKRKKGDVDEKKKKGGRKKATEGGTKRQRGTGRQKKKQGGEAQDGNKQDKGKEKENGTVSSREKENGEKEAAGGETYEDMEVLEQGQGQEHEAAYGEGV